MAEKKKRNVHDGHRLRMKKRLIDVGFDDSTPPHILLEMLLYFSVPRRDTNPIAHDLLDRFGSVENVINASTEELLKIKGITENTVSLFRIYSHINRRIICDGLSKVDYLMSYDAIGEYFVKRFSGLKNENVALMCLKASGKMISFEFIGEGDIMQVGLCTRKVLEVAIKNGAAIVALAHNHPSGIAVPSPIDIEVTKGLIASFSQVGLKLLDHIIIADGEFVSMAQSREFKDYF